MKNLVKLCLTLTTLIFCVETSAEGSYKTQPLQATVKALQVHRAGWALSYPVIYMNEAIEISFDMLDSDAEDLSYTILHCDADWSLSDLSVNEYLEGFQTNYIDNYEYSQAANVSYVHYQLQVPNASTRLLVSGNYLIIFKDENTGNEIAHACFSVVDQQATITGAVGGITTGGASDHMQQLNFSIDHGSYPIEQALTETKVIVKQNNSSHRTVQLSTPTYIYDGRLVYDNIPKLAFPGGDEYRYFDCSSTRFAGQGILDIQFFEPFYHINLRPNTCRYLLAYNYDDDINGKFLVRRQESNKEDIPLEADYVIAHFSLAMKDPILDGKVYLGGAFTYDALDKTTQMTYIPERQRYEADVLLKQGYYNYRYYVRDNRTGTLKSQPIERDAYAAENDYLIFFYHRPFGERYDRLIAFQVVNSLRE